MSEKYNEGRLQEVLERLSAAKNHHPYPSLEQRQQLLSALQHSLMQYEVELLEALQTDYGHRAPEESRLIELLPTLHELKHAKQSLKNWMKPSKRHLHFSIQPSRGKVLYQPKGIVGVISPWNYPVLLSLGPLIGAIAAGNRVMIKASEFCPATNRVLSKLLLEALGQDWVCFIEGEADVANAFTQLPLDHILFTGSSQVGKKVMANAALNLTPVTLELGGKSPLVVTQSANLERVADRLLFGKMMNAGQTCVAPDYILCHQSHKSALIDLLKTKLGQLYPQGIASPDYTSMINARQLDRLQSYLKEAEQAEVLCENLMTGPAELEGKLALHVLHEANDTLQVMQDEIFGPLLPILTYDTFGEALDYIQQRPRPLAMYVFTSDNLEMMQCEERIHSGSLVFNHTLVQVAQVDLPFGGTGHSGMGSYHAKEGFITFSHAKSVVYKQGPDLLAWLLPPYQRKPHKLFAKIWRHL